MHKCALKNKYEILFGNSNEIMRKSIPNEFTYPLKLQIYTLVLDLTRRNMVY